MSQFFEIVEIDGKGQGVIAKKNIKKGATILQEQPQLSTYGEADFIQAKNLMKNFFKLSQNEQNEYMKLSDNDPEFNPHWVSLKS